LSEKTLIGSAPLAIESCVRNIPDDFMTPADRQLVLDQLLQRRATLVDII
jgi:hypothetical protein